MDEVKRTTAMALAKVICSTESSATLSSKLFDFRHIQLYAPSVSDDDNQ